MGAYTCQYGFIHKRCRCTKPHTMLCDTPEAHQHEREPYVPKHRKDTT